MIGFIDHVTGDQHPSFQHEILLGLPVGLRLDLNGLEQVSFHLSRDAMAFTVAIEMPKSELPIAVADGAVL